MNGMTLYSIRYGIFQLSVTECVYASLPYEMFTECCICVTSHRNPAASFVWEE